MPTPSSCVKASQLLLSMQRDLGTFRQARRTSFQSDGSAVVLVYESDLANGKASEQFGYTLRDGKAYLISYKISSPSLVVR